MNDKAQCTYGFSETEMSIIIEFLSNIAIPPDGNISAVSELNMCRINSIKIINILYSKFYNTNLGNKLGYISKTIANT